ncbi:hypothetical protein BHU72_14715 [Desulfuribacillus stibiiarsenatis]|uniref:Uncharacterized protein n=1 Tax=Desulfuribacillus stibiiarsenatis TaxID=1390249 RepID=A0A1E5L768_9FIRM|nr:hypothetical protein [Desulfuribacillus stibiiarsenatis]OEH86002.1 hypothetical protein BHU72_14715 [Desulfuribacillus stibiiarsenatis]
MNRILLTTVIAVVFFMAFFLLSPNVVDAGYVGIEGSIIPEEVRDILESEEKMIYIWRQTYPEMIREGAKWDEYRPDAIKFYIEERGLADYFSVSSNIMAVQTYLHNSRLVTAFTSVFASLKHIERATNFTIFRMIVEMIAPISFALWSYIKTYWWELFFTLGIAYVLVGLILRKFLWMMVRFLLILAFSGLLVALFSPGYELWDDALTGIYKEVNKHSGHLLDLSISEAKISMSEDFATNIGNTMYYLNVVQPFILGQFGSNPPQKVIQDYFAFETEKKRHDFVDKYLREEKIDLESLMLSRGELSTKMKWVNRFGFFTYAGLGYASAIIEILLVMQIIPLMISLVFGSLPTDESLGEVRNRVITMAKLFLGKLVLAFVVSVGTYVNVFLMNKVSERLVFVDEDSHYNAVQLTIQDAQFLTIITYIGTIYYAWKLLKWIWTGRDYTVNKAKNYGSQLKGIALNTIKYKVLKNMSEQFKEKPRRRRPVRSKPAEKPRELTPRDRAQALRENRDASSGKRATQIRSMPRSQPMARRI